MAESIKKYRYPGTQPFEQNDSSEYRGRQNDITAFFKIISQEKCSVLFGKSGLGKTSLIRAGILPLFYKQISEEYSDGSKQVFTYIIRLGIKQENDHQSLSEKIEEVIAKQDNLNFLQTNPFLPANTASKIWHHFKSRQLTWKSKKIDPLFVLVLDQFEEFFTYKEDETYAFKIGLAELLSDYAPANLRNYLGEKELEEQTTIPKEIFTIGQASLPVKIIISIRSDKYNLLNRLKDAVPNINKNVYELQPLDAEQARQAIEEPATLTTKDEIENKPDFDANYPYHTLPYTYDAGVVDKILNFLIANTSADREYSNERSNIEPYCLQIICSHLEKNKIKIRNQKSITPEDVTNLNEIIESYYMDSIKLLNLEPAMQEKVFDILEEEMIYKKDKRRLILYKSILMDKFELDEGLLIKLTETRLIRAENYSSGGTSFEISHDALVEPILLARIKRKDSLSKINSYLNVDSDPALKQYNDDIQKRPNDYYAYKRRGDYYSSKNEYQQAINDYLKAGKLKPKDIDILNSLGIIFYKTGQFEKALEYYDAALEIDSNFEYAYLNKGLIYQKLGQTDLAINNYHEALRANPNYVEALNNLGLLYESRKEYDKAREYYGEAIALDPQYIYPLLNIGNIYFKQQNPEEAKNYYEKVLLIDPTYPPAIYNLGLYMMDHEKYDDAIAYFKKANELDPLYEPVIQSLGFVYEKQGSLDKALKQYELVKTKSELLCEDFYRLGNTFYDKNEFDKSIICFLHAVDIKPAFTEALNNLGLSYYQSNQLADALHYFTMLQSVEPDYVLVYNNLGLVYEKLNEIEKAEKNYLKAIDLDPSFDKAIKNIGLYYKKNKQLEKALHWFLKGLGQKPDEYTLHTETGLVYFDLKDFPNAELHMKEALRIHPDYLPALNILGLISEQDGSYLEAIQYYEQVIELDNDSTEVYDNLLNCYEKATASDDSIYNKLTAEAYTSIGVVYYKKQNYKAAKQCFDKSVLKDKTFMLGYYNLGLVYEKLNNRLKAIENVLKAYELKSHDINTLIALGNLYVEQNNANEAEKFFKEAENIDADDSDVYIGLGNVNYKRNNFIEAFNFYKKALELDPNDTFVLNNLGAVTYQLGKLEEAIEYNERSIKIDPNYASPYDNLGSVYKDKKEYKKAFEYFQKAISLDSNDAMFFLDLGGLYRELAQYDKALELVHRSIELDDILPEAWYNLGLIYFDEKELSLATQHLKKAIEVDNHFRDAYLKLGEIAEAENNFDTARKYYEDAELIAPHDVHVRLHLAGLFIKANKLQEANAILAEIQPGEDSSNNLSSYFYETLGDLEMRKGNIITSAEYYLNSINKNKYNESVLEKLIKFYHSQNNISEADKYSSQLKALQDLKILS